MRTNGYITATVTVALRVSAVFPTVSGTLNVVSAANVFKRWTTSQETQAAIGFDSNVYGTLTGARGDGFAMLAHEAKLARKNTLTQLELSANISTTRFLSESEGNFTDGGVALYAAYPNDPLDVSSWNANAYWRRETSLNLDTGRRLQPTTYGVRLAGEWLASPKMGYTGLVQASVYDGTRDGYGTTRSLAMRTGITHAWRPEQRWGLEYGLTLGHSDAGAGADSVRHLAGVRARGKLLPKVSGEAFIGVRHSEFSGAYDFSDTGPNMEADLTWTASPKFTTRLGVSSDYEFTADGSATLRTSVTLAFDRRLGRGFRATVTISPGQSSYERDVVDRRDRFWILGTGLEYSRNERFFARWTMDWVSNQSDDGGHDVSRGVVTLQAGLRY